MRKGHASALLLTASLSILVCCDSCSSWVVPTSLAYLGEALPSTCPAPVVDQEELQIPGFGAMKRLTTSNSYDLSALRLNNQGQIAMNTFAALGIVSNCYAAVLIGDDVKVLAGAGAHPFVTGLNDTIAVGSDAPNPLGHSQAVAWQNASVSILPGASGKDANALAVNNAGDAIVGTVQDGESFELVRWDWTGETWAMSLLGVPSAHPTGVNGRGQIVGWIEEKASSNPVDTSRLAFLFEDGNITMLPVLPGNDPTHYIDPVSQINDSGWIVGTLRLAAGDGQSATFRATLWKDSSVADLGTLGGRSSGAIGINSGGQIVGWAETPDGVQHACIWNSNGVPRNLDDVLTPLGITLGTAYAINDTGAILATTADTYDVVLLVPSQTTNRANP